MNVVGLFTVVYILGGAEPSVDLVPHEFMPLQECREKVKDFSSTEVHELFHEGKPLLMVKYQCVVYDTDALQRAWEELK